MQYQKNMFSTVFIMVSMYMIFSISTIFAQGRGTISGTVSSSDSEELLPGANVYIVGTMLGASASTDGSYELSVQPGTYKVKASFIGYGTIEKEVTVVAGEETAVDFTLDESPVAFGESLVVLGSRTARTAIETPVPIDIISAREIQESPAMEINQILAYLAPSFNASHQTISDGTDHINPASLRGLGPDQVLVLVNGKRRHQSALVHVNGTFGRGTVGVDLNSIPKSAIARIEVLRDGASAQYGSDAIAGVINIVLKEQTKNIEINSTTGITGEGDGEQVEVDVNYGFAIGDRGFFNVTAQFMDRTRTNRSDDDTRDMFTGISGFEATNAEIARRGLTRSDFSMKTGQGNAIIGMAFFNTAYQLSDNAELYASGGLSHRNGDATGFYRRPSQESQVVPEIFPNGFLPQIHTEIVDQSIIAGLRGNKNGWDVDLSLTHGSNSFQFNIENTNNASLGTSSPTSFDAGRLQFSQSVGNLDLVRPFAVEGINSFSLALGGEFRIENFQIEAGEDASWQLGNGGDRAGVDFDTTAAGGPKAAGSQVFPGFQPSNEVNRYRNSISAYAGLEVEINDQFLIDVGGRYENFNDFGNTLVGKVAARYEPIENFAFRGAVSTGFRAPSLHQVWFSNVSTQFVTVDGVLQPLQVLTANNKSSVAKAFGIPDLKEETSVNISVGFTARPHPKLSVTADVYNITIDDRIVLTSRFTNSDPNFAAILAPFADAGVSQAQMFSNVVDTKTTGIDIVTAYFTPLGSGKLDVTLSANFTDTEVDKVNIPKSSIAAFEAANGRAPNADELAGIANTFFNREEFNRLETALPREKGTLGLKYTQGKLRLGTRASYYGDVLYRPTNSDNDEKFDAKVLFDLDISYEIFEGTRLTVGGNNILNTFPDKHQKASNLSSGRFPFSRRVTQFGTNGGFYYARLSLSL